MAREKVQFPAQPLAPYDPGPLREAVRGAVALFTTAAFFAVVFFYLYQAARGSEANWQRFAEAMHSVLPAVTSILGTALGFYFGSQKC